MTTKSSNIGQRENWGSRVGYILSTLGMAIGVGAMWRFPMLTAQYGGGAFVLAFTIICVVIVLPAGWAEIALGRKYKKSVVGTFTELEGTKGKIFGYFTSATPFALMFYYPIIMAFTLIYIYHAVTGAPFLAQPEIFYEQVNGSNILIFACVVGIILLTAFINLGGIQKGIEKTCKTLLPIMFVFLIIITVRVLTLPGIGAGLEFYLAPDWSQFFTVDLWMAAAGMALFAVGVGPGYLLTFGSYLSDKADIPTDFTTVNFTQLFLCILCGFVTIPAVVLFGLDPAAGKGLIFQSLPLVFSQLPGGMLWFIVFMVSFFFAGLSTTISMMEIPVASLMDGFNWSRKKGVAFVTIVSIIGAIPCIWSDQFFVFIDNLVGNVFYCVTAAVLTFYLAWVIGAKVVRTEWYNPTSAIKYGSWVDFILKYLSVPAFAYFAIVAILTLF